MNNDIYTLEFYIVFYSIVALIIFLIINNKKTKKLKKEIEERETEIKKIKEEKINEAYLVFPYTKINILTEREKIFYNELIKVANNFNLHILSKIRLADIIKINDELTETEKEKYLYKILYKHIDFALCEKENLEPIILIELQDNTHKLEERILSDRFKKTVLEKCGYKILFTYDANNLENKINVIIKNRPL